MKVFIYIALIISTLISLGCSKIEPAKGLKIDTSKDQDSFWSAEFTSENTIQVLSIDGAPLSNAKVLVGSTTDSPFPGNEFITDESGYFKTPKNWKTALPVTIEADGYIRKTFINITPDQKKLQLSPSDGTANIEIEGLTKGYGPLKKDGFVDFSLVIPTIKKESLVNFDISQFISPQIDVVKVPFSSMEVPSNFALPKQKERHFINITFNKPKYRLYLREPGQYNFIATHGKFRLKKMIEDKNKGRSLFEMMNNFEFIGSGEKQVVATENMKGQDIDVGVMKFHSHMNIKGAQFSNQLAQMTVALYEKEGQLFPTDIKSLQSGEVKKLKTGSNNNVFLSVLRKNNLYVDRPDFINQLIKKNKNQDMDLQEMSLSLQTQEQAAHPPTFISLIAKPKVETHQISVNIPELPHGLKPLATFFILSEVEIIRNSDGTLRTEIKNRQWEVFTQGWVSMAELPQVSWERIPGKTYRWEALMLASSHHANLNENMSTSDILKSVTHVTRNSIDF